jgi:hypothetical protein
MKYIAQPYFSANNVKIYSLPGATLTTTIQPTAAILAKTGPPVVPPANPSGGANCVLLYQVAASTGESYLFVSYVFKDASGGVCVYKFSDINFSIASQTPTPIATLLVPNGAVGLAIQPGTGDLYVATDSNGNNDGGIYIFSKTATGYASSPTQFIDYVNDSSDAFICANLAFDTHGNLWMTNFDQGGSYLTCYTKPGGDPTQFIKIVNGSPLTNVKSLPAAGSTPAPASMKPFSEPEGLAFDPNGNLWIANNNDPNEPPGYSLNSSGSLLMINSAWIKNLLATSAPASSKTITEDDADIVIYYLNGSAMFGGLFFDGYTLYANDQGNGTVWAADVRSITTSFPSSNVPTTYPGNGTMAIFNTTPPSLLIRDKAGDTGIEPDTVAPANVLWESPDIGVTQTSILSTLPAANSAATTGLTALASDATITGGSTAYAYVRVTNIGTADTTGTEVLKIYWAKASAGLNWPTPWDGLEFDGSGSPFGGLIGAQPIGTIQPQKATFFEFEWTSVPVSTASDEHFCLLARIETSSLTPFGMDFPEETNGAGETALAYNVQQNSKIGWRNIAILPPPPVPPAGAHGIPFHLGILGANYSPRAGNFRFGIETLARNGKPAAIAGTLVLHAEGPTLQRLLETRRDEEALRYLGEGRFHLRNIARGIRNVRMRSREVLPFRVEFTPEENVRDFAVRVVQYVETDGGERVVGGQTFVVGKVEGFPVREEKRRY